MSKNKSLWLYVWLVAMCIVVWATPLIMGYLCGQVRNLNERLKEVEHKLEERT